MKFSWMVLKLQSRHDFVQETDTYKVQRGITQNYIFQELCFLHSAGHPTVVNISMQFHEDILNGESYRADTVLSQKLLLTKFRGT